MKKYFIIITIIFCTFVLTGCNINNIKEKINKTNEECCPCCEPGESCITSCCPCEEEK